MRLFYSRISASILRAARAVPYFALSLSLIAQPAFATTITGTPFNVPSGQSGAQQQNANNNSLASNLGKAASVLSMAAGGLYMAKGATQLKCCTSSCSGSSGTGDSAKNAKDGIDNKTKDGVKKDGLRGWNCPAPGRPSPFRLFDLFAPPRADAQIGACLDALIALTTGGLMLLNGIMGLQAANQSQQMADNSLGNAGNMSSYNPNAATSPTGPGSSNLGGNGNTAQVVKLDPALLRTGTANNIMGQFEKTFGIPRDKFADGVLGGEDPRKILGSAPMNALSNADMNKATDGAKAMSAADKAKALGGTDLANAEKELAGRMGDGTVNLAGGPAPTRAVASEKKGEKIAENEEPAAEITATPSLSPEVQKALADKEHQDRLNGITDMTIFEVVHAKYREKSKMIFGYDPDSVPKGVTP